MVDTAVPRHLADCYEAGVFAIAHADNVVEPNADPEPDCLAHPLSDTDSVPDKDTDAEPDSYELHDSVDVAGIERHAIWDWVIVAECVRHAEPVRYKLHDSVDVAGIERYAV